MASRHELHEVLCKILGSRNVYYQPPENLKMAYNAIRYSKDVMYVGHANDHKYKKMNRYQLIVICKEPDPEAVDKLLELPYSSMGTPYRADNLNHYPITLYY